MKKVVEQMTTDLLHNPKKRLVSLDVFRGATIAGMMLVNNPGDWSYVYAPFRHSAWNGWTYTDTIFPSFLWIMGVAMTLSFSKRMEHGQNKQKLLVHVLLRSAIIFAIGLFLNGFPFGLLFGENFSAATMRIPGVLQRIAVCYFFASVIFLWTGRRWQIIWTAFLLCVYALLLKLVPVPGFGAGLLQPQGNLCWYIDSNLLAGHTWLGAPAPGFDPEGILSTLGAIATTMFGVLTGQFLRSERTSTGSGKDGPENKTIKMFITGFCLMFGGTVLDYVVPINKNMWTSSYALFMAGLALVVFAMCYWLIDVRGMHRARAWTKPFEIYGQNPIVLYALSELLAEIFWMVKIPLDGGSSVSLQGWYYQHLFLPIGDPMVASFLHSCAFVCFFFLVAYGMHRKGWMVRL